MVVPDPRFDAINAVFAGHRFWYLAPLHGGWMVASEPAFGVLDPANFNEGDDPQQPYLAFVDGGGQGARYRWPRCGMPEAIEGGAAVRVRLEDWQSDRPDGTVDIRRLDVAAGQQLGVHGADDFTPGDSDHEEWFAQGFRGEQM